MKINNKIGLFVLLALALVSCSKKEPSLVFFPDMYYPVAYDAYMEKIVPFTGRDSNTVALFQRNQGMTALTPVPGTVSINKDNVQGLDLPNTPEGKIQAMAISQSPLDEKNKEADMKKGEFLYTANCASCHGTAGDGQGTIVKSKAYSGVPDYATRDLSLGTVYYVIDNGMNAMGAFSGQLSVGDRWRVAMYVMEKFKGQTVPGTVVPEKEPAPQQLEEATATIQQEPKSN